MIANPIHRAGAQVRNLTGIAPMFVLLLLAFVALTACSGTWGVDYGTPLEAKTTKGWRVSKINVSVPDSLTISEQNLLTPNADIVWHGDPPGDRRAQVRTIVAEAARRAVAPLRGGKSVTLNLTVTQFHGVTFAAIQKSPAAVHNIQMVAEVIDNRTGKPLTPQTPIKADLPAYVGAEAFAAIERGETQKVRVTHHIDAVLKGWLGIGPDIRGSFSSVGR